MMRHFISKIPFSNIYIVLDAEEIANGIVFLVSKKASGINGEVLFVDGGIDALMHSERF